MTSIYTDTSGALACLLATRAGHQTARATWEAADDIVSVRLIHVEARSALAALRRARLLRPSAHVRAKEGWPLLWQELTVIEADEQLVDRAADLAERYRLRGYDAIHLAGAEVSGCGLLMSGDRELCRASLECAIAVIDLNDVE